MSFTSIDHCSNSLGLYSVFVIINIRPFSFIITKKGGKANTKKFAVVLGFLKEEYSEGRADGRIEGKLEALIELVQDGTITIEKAASQINKTVPEFMELMSKAK